MKEIDVYERSITTRYRAALWSKFVKSIQEFKLIDDSDIVLLIIDNYKASLITSKLLVNYNKYFNRNFKLIIVAQNNNNIIKNLNLIKIPDFIVEEDTSNIEALVEKYNCNKVVSFENYDDVIELTLSNILYNGKYETYVPKTKKNGYTLIRPLYYIRDKDLTNYRNYHELVFDETPIVNEHHEVVKNLIKDLSKSYCEDVDKNIFHASMNITLDMIIGYEQNGIKHSFLDTYDQELEDIKNSK